MTRPQWWKSTYVVEILKMKIGNVTDLTLRQSAVCIWESWRLDESNDRTTNSWSAHNRHERLRHGDNWRCPLQILLALENRRYFDILTSRPAANNRFWLTSRQDLRSNSKEYCWFALRAPLALDHHLLFDLLTCRLTVDDRIRFTSRWTSRSKSKLS